MNVIGTLFKAAGIDTMRRRSSRHDQEMPMMAMYELLWAYYLNNGLYDGLREAGYRLDNRVLKEIYNPAGRVVEFYVDTIWPGPLERALPLQTENDAVAEAIRQVWRWSNWAGKKQVAVRWGAITGNVWYRVARPLPVDLALGREVDAGAELPRRVYIQLIRAEHVTEHLADERGYIIYARLDIPQEQAGHGEGGRTRPPGRAETTATWYTEVWEPDRLRVWAGNKHGASHTVDQLGVPDYEVDITREWGIDFVPLVHAKHIDIGEELGVGSYTLQLSKINELNQIATRLHQILFRHNGVTWALESNMMDASNRPIPAPRLRGSSSTPGASEDLNTVELGDETMIRLPGMAKLTPLTPQLNYTAHLAVVEAMLAELERDLPELAYSRLKDLPEMSGKALRLLLTPAIARATEVRGNMEEALARAHMMALTIGDKIKAFEGLRIGSYERGDFEHTFAARPFFALTRQEVAELATAETGAGIPLVTSLRNSGWTEAQIAQMQEDREAEQAAQQMTLASAILNAQGQFDGGGQSNGLERPGGIQQPAQEQTGPVDTED